MKIVIDSNVLFRILISQGKIIDLMFNPNIKIYAPKRLWQEFLKNEDEIIIKSNLSKKDFQILSSLLLKKITLVDLEDYKKFIPKARKLLANHNKDEEFIALCLLKNCKLWTYENRLFEIGFGISTKELSKKLL